MLCKISGEVPKVLTHFIHLGVCNIAEFLPCAEIILFIPHNAPRNQVTLSLFYDWEKRGRKMSLARAIQLVSNWIEI